MSVASFDSLKSPLKGILENVSTGKTQLPDFQRGWVWDDAHIKSLIASLSQSFPIGAVMTLENGSEDVRFKPRPIEGTATGLEDVNPDILLLDGQQRLTSLFQTLLAGRPVETKDATGKSVRRWYYLDMKRCLDVDDDREEAVLSIPEDKLVRTFRGDVRLDLSSEEKEYNEHMFPLHRIFNVPDWERGYIAHWNLAREQWDLFQQFNNDVIKSFEQYHLPVIHLNKETPKEAVCLVFEKVNTGGVPLTVFELLTASFAADDFRLRDDWREREERLKQAHPVLRGQRHSNGLQSDHFLQALTLLATNSKLDGATSCRRRDILRLTVGDYHVWARAVEDGFARASRFLRSQKIFSNRDLPYQTQIVPLAAILASLGMEADTEGARQKISEWFWCGVFGEGYSGQTETVFARDLPEVTAWVRGAQDKPTTVQDANFQPDRLVTLKTRNSAAYKGVHALLMRDGSRDFLTGESIEEQTYYDDSIDIHHIFPKAYCSSKGISPALTDSIINKTALSARTNRMIGGRKPSVYLPIVQRRARVTADHMDDILATHCIPTGAMRADDFSSFFTERGKTLLRRIEAVMGKAISPESSVITAEEPPEDYDEGPIDWDEQGTLGNMDT